MNTGERKKMGKYVVIDFEMCPVAPEKRRYFRCRHEIIQIGAALMNEDLEIEDTFSCYVRPSFGKLDSFIQGLTGICWADLKDAPKLKDALRQFLAWLPEETVTAAAWSNSDESQLRREMECKKLSPAEISMRIGSWVDCQAMFAEKMRIKRCYSLQEALIAADIFSGGRAHNGMDDARNTALLFRKLLTEEEIRLNPYYEEAHRPGRGSTLQFSLGDLLKGLDLEPGLSA